MKQPSLGINALLSAIKQCCTIVFPLITFPYVSRVLGVEKYGEYNFGYAYINYFVLFAGLGISAYSIREGSKIREDKEKIRTFVNEIFSINVLSMVISYTILFVTIILWDRLSGYRTLILVQSLAIVLNTIGTDWINYIYEDFTYITVRYILFQCVSLFLVFAFVKAPEDYITYAGINVFANAGANIFNLLYVKKYIKKKFTLFINLKTHIRPLLYLFCNTLAVTIYVNLDITLLGIFKSDIDVGVYSVAVKIYSIVKQLINAITMVIIPRVGYFLGKKNSEQYNKLLNNTLKTIVMLALPSIVGMSSLATELILIVAGEEYLDADIAVIILSVAMIFAVLGCFFTNAILISNNKENIVLKATVLSAGLNVGLNLIFIPFLGINGAAITTVIAEATVAGIAIKHSKKLWKCESLKNTLYSSIAGAVSVVLIINIFSILISDIFARLIFCILISLLIYSGVLLIMKNENFLFLIDKAKRLGEKHENSSINSN